MTAELAFRPATRHDLPDIVRLLADDPLGQTREILSDPLHAAYTESFARMSPERGNYVIVATADERVVACLQLSLIDGLSRLGMRRAQLEGIRVDTAYRSRGIGTRLIRHAIDVARSEGCGLVQLTTDISRPRAKRYYERFGFVASHHGMKLAL